jgi:hypothetical protein
MDPMHVAMYRGAENCTAHHSQYIWPVVQEEEAIIITDSLLKNVHFLRRTSVHAIPGASTETIEEEIQRSNIDICYQKTVLICVGTNNLTRDSPCSNMCKISNPSRRCKKQE